MLVKEVTACDKSRNAVCIPLVALILFAISYIFLTSLSFTWPKRYIMSSTKKSG